MTPGALDGVRVLDLTRVMSGPYCTQMLGDMGADVVKVEQPGRGDDTRHWRPPAVGTESAYYLSVNRNKRSVALDLKGERGKDAVRRLAARSDVVVENFSPGTAARLGLGYEQVRGLRPDVVYCSVSGFGQDGPGHRRTAYDLIVQGMGGLMSVTGPPGEPSRLGVPIADIAAGMFAAYAIVAALYRRERTGEGQYIDASMLGAELALATYQAHMHWATGETPRSTGNAHAIIAPYQTFRTADGFLNLAVGNDAIWRRFCPAVGLDRLLEEERYATNAGRITHLAALAPEIQAAFLDRSTAELVALLDAAAVPCGPILSVPEALEQPQAAFLEQRRSAPHPTLGSVDVLGFPYALSGTPPAVRRAPPTLGQHTEEVLRELGYAPEEVAAYRAEGGA